MESEEKPGKLDSFEKLLAWQAARELAKQTYILTRQFPKDEQFALTNQMRRAASSVSANIAEGFSRQTIADKLHFYTIAAGSLTELQSFMYIALDVGYINEDARLLLYSQSVKGHKLLIGLIKSTRNRK
ncbi:MAG TPA: four helix bundle protein [Candidatus Limnocylindria bacterium]|nr:four helix bundle protein [Candidatus Limnocylindria bacterium]